MRSRGDCGKCAAGRTEFIAIGIVEPMTKPFVYGSVCSGIEAASVAWKPLGWCAAFFAEIESFPSSVLAHHYPNVRNLGDFTNIRSGWLRRIGVATIDLL